MAAVDVCRIEDDIRNLVLTKRIRPSEFFLDYDRLRSGYVTESQFFRVIWDNLGLKYTDEERCAITRKYDSKGDGRINYRAFVETINQSFNPNDLNSAPMVQQPQPMEFLGTSRPLSAASEEKLRKLLVSLNCFYKYHGINLRTCCEDFDRHHIGVINESQFYRSFPRPPEVSDEDIALILAKYRDPERPGLFNYLNFHQDIMSVQPLAEYPEVESVRHYLPPKSLFSGDPNLQEIFDKIRIAVYKNRVRTIEFFRDYDKLRSGCVTENQFVCGLSLAVGKEAQLLRPEIQKIVEFYKRPDGAVCYKEFCDMMENAFNIPHLEKKPTLSVVRPPEGALGRNLNQLSEAEEARVAEVMRQLSSEVKKRRVMMYQYFKDYDRAKSYSRVITVTQFGRILHFLSLNVAPEDLKLLCKKFEDAATGDVNYPAFVQSVDQDFVNYTQDLPEQENIFDPEVDTLTGKCEPDEPPVDFNNVDMETLLARIRHIVLTNRLRTIEYFHDFDKLRSGSITKSQFGRCLAKLGLSSLGHHHLSDPQLKMLTKYYSNPDVPDKVIWTKFMNDVDSVFTQNNLEKTPTVNVPPAETFLVPKPGTVEWHGASEEQWKYYNIIMSRLKARARERRVLVKPVFQDFDRHNNGHVTRKQFRQVMAMVEIYLNEDEMKTLESKFCNDTGFNYIAFLKELTPQAKVEAMYTKRLETLRKANTSGKLPDKCSTVGDLESVLIKIKNKVCKERIRIHEWSKDYDKLRSGRMLQGNFRRSLDMCRFELTESEIAFLEDHYRNPGDPGFIDYLRFSDDIESIFTIKNLEKAPLLDVAQYRPPEEWQLNELEPELELTLRQCMERLAEKVRKTCMQLFPLFEDYDRIHNGTVSQSQFRRVLTELELSSLVGTEYDWQLLWRRFRVRVGGKDDVNYIAFCDMVYEMARFEWRKP